jgi:tRNA A37 threonylcarbamoyladenosine dehydratase
MKHLEQQLQRLAEETEHDHGLAIWKPIIYSGLTNKSNQEDLEELVKSGEVVVYHDHIKDQLEELIQTRDPSRKWSKEETLEAVKLHLTDTPFTHYGSWVYFPWSRSLVHILPQDEYREVRSDRNRFKITSQEQQQLAKKCIGIVGLSAGRTSALTMAQEGVATSFRLADFDNLSLSNMNRLQSGVENLNINKAVLAARAMFAIDPYLNIEIFTDGITENNLENFLTGGGTQQLDLLVEECDDLFMKVHLRERAKDLRIPVIMETNERGLVDIERFDLEPERPLFHGLVGELKAEQLKGLSKKEKVPWVMRIIGEETMSPRSTASLVEIDETTSSWPQLASGSALGGAMTTDVTRRIFLGEFNTSGRFFVDLSEQIQEGKSAGLSQAKHLDMEVLDEALKTPELTTISSSSTSITEAEVRALVAHGILAPSGHNCQPWRFEFSNQVLYCYHDLERSQGILDFENSASYLAFGAVVENIELAANAAGFEIELNTFPDSRKPDLVCTLSFHKNEDSIVNPNLQLFSQIPHRATNRKLGDRVSLSSEEVSSLVEAVRFHQADLQLLQKDEELYEIGKILGAVDRFCFTSTKIHHELMEGFRWTPEEVKTTRDGLDIATLELSATDVVGMRLVSNWKAMKMVGAVGGGRVLEKVSKKAVAAASAVGLITVEGTNPEAFFQGGRAMQRVWLTASAMGLGIQPLTVFPYLYARVERGAGDGFSKGEQQKLKNIRDRYLNLFKVNQSQSEPLLFRISKVDPPSARSLRRNIGDVFYAIES